MPKKIFYSHAGLITSLSLFLLSAVCSAGAVTQLPVEKVEDLKNYITATSLYTNWKFWPGTGKFYKGSRPHGAYLTTYVNDIALQALLSGRDTFPQGSIIVKENYTDDKQLNAVTVMYRVNGYNPSGGDWYWLKYGADGKVLEEGKVLSCIGCHSAVRSKDWVFTARP